MNPLRNWRQPHHWSRSRTSKVLTSCAGALALSGAAVQWIPVLPIEQVLALGGAIFALAFAGRMLLQRRRASRDDTDEAGA